MPLAMSRQRLTSSDAMFLYLESRETMMHVAGLLTFAPPPDAPPDHLRRLVDEMRVAPVVHRPWNLKLRTPDLLMNPLQTWVEADLSRADDLSRALDGCQMAFYLVHSLGEGTAQLVDRERERASAFALAAERAGLERIVYLGGVAP